MNPHSKSMRQNKAMKRYITGSCGVTLLLCSFAMTANSSINKLPLDVCMFEESYESNMYIHRYDRECMEEYDRCIANIKSQTNSAVKRNDCITHELNDGTIIEGHCPDLLTKLEDTNPVEIDQMIALVNLRDLFFYSANGSRANLKYKYEESKHLLSQILEREPHNIVAKTLFERYSISDDDLRQKILLNLDIFDIDYRCTRSAPSRIRAIVHLFHQIFRPILTDLANNPQKQRRKDEEISNLANRVWDTILLSYERSLGLGSMYDQLVASIRFVEPPFIFTSDEAEQAFFELLGINPMVDRNVRKAKVKRIIFDRYLKEGRGGRHEKIKVLCNEYAFELNLIAECAKMLLHYGTSDKEDDSAIPDDIYNGAVILLINTTRNCESRVNYVLQLSISDSRLGKCYRDFEDTAKSVISEILSNFASVDQMWRYSILKSYISMDSRTPSFFKLALREHSDSLYHTLLLTKRLLNRGYKEAATQLAIDSLDIVRLMNGHTKEEYSRKMFSARTAGTGYEVFARSNMREMDIELTLNYVVNLLRTDKRVDFLEVQNTFNSEQ